MKNAETVFMSMKYIEAHMTDDLKATAIAAEAGYSVFYFSRMFCKVAGMPVMEYVKKRRLVRASEDILDGAGILDTALKYGYQSHSGFTKAFKNEFGFSPALLRGLLIQKTYITGGSAMEHVFMKQTDVHESKEMLYQKLVHAIRENKIPCDLKKSEQVYAFAGKAYEGQMRYSGDEYVTHLLNVAILAAEMGGDEDTILAGMLCDVFQKTDVGAKDIDKVTGCSVRKILEQAHRFKPEEADLTEWKVIVVKLAEWLHNMRTLEFMDENQWNVKAKQAAEFYLPIANQIEERRAAAELNDLAMKYVSMEVPGGIVPTDSLTLS